MSNLIDITKSHLSSLKDVQATATVTDSQLTSAKTVRNVKEESNPGTRCFPG